MKLIKILSTLLFIFLSQSGFAAFDQLQIDSAIQEFVQKENFSGVVLVALDGKPQFHKAYGLASRSLNVPNTLKSKFVIASISKQFTAAAIMKLVQDGKLNVQTLISQLLPNTPETWKGMTVHQLMIHMSGLKPNPHDVPGFRLGTADVGEALKYHTLPHLIEFFKLSQPDQAPNTQFIYSNMGYTILAAIVEKVSGQDFIQYMEKNIFLANGLENTGFYHPTKIIEGFSEGYWKTENGFGHSCCYEPLNYIGAASNYSTVEDLLKWDQILRKNEFFTPEITKEIFTPWAASYGYGWVIANLDGENVTWHNGSQFGISSALYRLEKGRTIIILSNMYQVPVDKMARKLIEITK